MRSNNIFITVNVFVILMRKLGASVQDKFQLGKLYESWYYLHCDFAEWMDLLDTIDFLISLQRHEESRGLT